MTTIDIGTLEDYVHGQAAQVRRDGRVLVVVRIEDDVYVLDDRCSHEDFSLAEGEVDVATCEIECARHGAMFQLKDGEPTSLPATRAVAHYDVVREAGRLLVVVS
ncbi:MAG: Rieske 2Fe-2S domain-containing protein [Acidobacteriota bacterium]|nr:Rieske 2Fe-2S domain-containing protein [Acidobacteriota bacterium]MDE3139358.1 Rieske 2Fe-2S domain-containing protein [Acidobacteriota bacterium]MDE3146599.1 Rieske 2Fe-2S domain-containing protein [Acidobacteriota bacterium]